MCRYRAHIDHDTRFAQSWPCGKLTSATGGARQAALWRWSRRPADSGLTNSEVKFDLVGVGDDKVLLDLAADGPAVLVEP